MASSALNFATIQDDKDELLAALGFFVILLKIRDAHEARNAQRHQNQLYLCRKELLPDPRSGTPWQRLWESQEDRAFIITMGFDVATFRLILHGFAAHWDTNSIPRNDVSSLAEPHNAKRSLDAAGALGLILHWLGSAMNEISLQQIFALTPTTCNHYLNFAEQILYDTLQCMQEASIKMPSLEAKLSYLSSLIEAQHPLLKGAFRSIDGLSLICQESDDPEIENATYNGWKTSHCINNVLVFSPEGVILSAAVNAPGSWHDSRVARGIFEQLRTLIPNNFFLVANTAFPRGTTAIDGKIRAPLKAGNKVTSNRMAQQHLMAENRQLLSYCQTAEWGMHTIQGLFGRLRVPLCIADPDRQKRLLDIQIRAVYLPIWKKAEGDDMWDDLGNIMFGEIRKRDRVSHFHLEIVESQSKR